MKNQKKYLDWLGETLGYKSQNDWYELSQDIVDQNYGAGLLHLKYDGSPVTLLSTVYSELEWIPWKFEHVAQV